MVARPSPVPFIVMGTVMGLAIGLASACTVLYGPSSEELSGGAKTDGSASSSSSSSGTLPDGASSSSTASSASSSGADAGAFVCPQGALACEGFESGAPGFPKKEGTIDVTAGGHDSAKSLEAVLVKNQPSPQLTTTLDIASHGATVSFWFKPDGPPPDDVLSFRLTHVLWGRACDWELSWQLFLRKDGVYTETDAYDEDANPSCGPVDFKSEQLLPAARVYDGNWHRITVTMDASSKTRTTKTQIDAEPPVDLAVTSAQASLPDDVELAIGVPCVQESGGCFAWQGATYRVRFDDVALTPK